MRIKHAYNTLVNSSSGRKYDSGNRSSDFSNCSSHRSQSRNPQTEEEFYEIVKSCQCIVDLDWHCPGLLDWINFNQNIIDFACINLNYSCFLLVLARSSYGNFLRDFQIAIEDVFKDLQEEFRNWEELAEIGEEFVEFLEKELNIVDPEVNSKNNYETPQGGNPSSTSGTETPSNTTHNEAGQGNSSIKDNLDEIEATLAQLKMELGL